MQAILMAHDKELNHTVQISTKLIGKPTDIYLDTPDVGVHYNVRISVVKSLYQYLEKYKCSDMQIKIYNKVYDIHNIEFYKSNRAKLDVVFNQPE